MNFRTKRRARKRCVVATQPPIKQVSSESHRYRIGGYPTEGQNDIDGSLPRQRSGNGPTLTTSSPRYTPVAPAPATGTLKPPTVAVAFPVLPLNPVP